MEDSILTSTKKILGLSEDYDAFDLDIIMHINSSLTILSQLGIGPVPSIVVEDDSEKWADLGVSPHQLGMVKTYIYLKTRMLFDPPSTSFVIEAVNNMIQEHEHRLVASAELTTLNNT